MSRYLSEGSPEKQIGGLGFGRRQLERRPAVVTPVFEAGATVTKATFTTPWTSDGSVGAFDLESFYTEGTDAPFELAASGQGITFTGSVNTLALIEADLAIRGTGSAHGIPTRMRLMVASGDDPPDASYGFSWLLVRDVSLPAGPVDNDFIDRGYALNISSYERLEPSSTYCVRLWASGAASDWELTEFAGFLGIYILANTP